MRATLDALVERALAHRREAAQEERRRASMFVYRIVYRTRSGGYRTGRKEYATLREAKKAFATAKNAKRIDQFTAGGWPRMF